MNTLNQELEKFFDESTDHSVEITVGDGCLTVFVFPEEHNYQIWNLGRGLFEMNGSDVKDKRFTKEQIVSLFSSKYLPKSQKKV